MDMDNLRQRKPRVGDADAQFPLNADDELKDAVPRIVYRPAKPADGTNIYIAVLLTILALVVRLYKITNPAEVVFDEVHFGGFASKYINGKFFMDVHPPLGKLLIAASGVFAGFDGSFDFKGIGSDYLGPKVPYVAMRFFPGLFGVLLVPIAFLTMKNLGYSKPSAILAALLVTFENGLVTQSRLILLDSFLVFFTGLTAMMWSEFLTYQDDPFSLGWFNSLALTGVALGLTLSVKWVGLFLVALIGLSTIQNLWKLLGDTRNSLTTIARHFIVRAICLIVIPMAVYMAMFQVHFWALPNSGSGSSFMSPEFQATLKGNEIAATIKQVGYGSKVYFRHEATNGGYLHSHKSTYPGGSKQQQMTCYPFRGFIDEFLADENSGFTLLPPLEVINGTIIETNVTEFKRIKHGDIIRLEHAVTNKRLHSHDIRAPVTDNENHYEASGYGAAGFTGDTNDHWRIEQLEFDYKNPWIDAIHTPIRLVHVNLGCKLFSHSVKLPEWGFGQQEVTCAKNGKKRLTTWRIEYNENPWLDAKAEKVNYQRPSFLKKFIEIHQTMWRINAGLTSSHPFDSRPDSWPTLKRGISFWTSKKGGGQIYLIGNPVIWYSATLSLLVYVAFEAVSAALVKRGIKVTTTGYIAQASQGGWFLFLGWFLHYIPFFLMARQLFLHHYFPALYFSILLFCAIFDTATRRLGTATQSLAALFVAAAAVWMFYEFSPLTYGTVMTKEHCKRLKWRSRWDFDCNRIGRKVKSSVSQVVSGVTGGAHGGGASPVAEAVPAGGAVAPVENPDET
ncbi:hypothetical protein HK097_008188 [Rhizophlyctis rosea]|uniref:Dolichyl-phosphate-mannose--protein mannosyltransferase n=1 Tax=Rhizophlyctis rosea TaxID=64517 RepID=A0AAD5SAL1_9FUNG|nr:hypothetical protein HK097_008188 [Rhizophlyctis rosea]